MENIKKLKEYYVKNPIRFITGFVIPMMGFIEGGKLLSVSNDTAINYAGLVVIGVSATLHVIDYTAKLDGDASEEREKLISLQKEYIETQKEMIEAHNESMKTLKTLNETKDAYIMLLERE